uniref:Uncharacterized protein n=1 Tax=Tanacetum cinerariifolium TaxID=118510 RepID=A0A699UPH7_TANCI|nr:hypothetical protein [Tanacetum cinerariifolium]
MEFFLYRFNPSGIYHGFLDVFGFSSTHEDDLLSNGVQTEIADRKCAYLTNQHDVTTSPLDDMTVGARGEI